MKTILPIHYSDVVLLNNFEASGILISYIIRLLYPVLND